MKTRRLALAGLGLLTALTFAAGGCAASGVGGDALWDGGAAAAPADPKEVLAGAAEELGKTSFKVNLKIGDSGTVVGTMDPSKKVGAITMTVAAEGLSMKIDTMVFDTDMYMKMDLGGETLPGMDPDKWIHLDVAKLPAGNTLGLKPGEFDPSGSAKFLGAVATAERVDDKTIKGTLDLTKAIGAAGLEKKDLTGLDAAAKSVPFQVTVDGEGRLATMTIDMPSLDDEPAQQIAVTYSDFGAPVQLTEPGADEVTEAPEAIYGTLTA